MSQKGNSRFVAAMRLGCARIISALRHVVWCQRRLSPSSHPHPHTFLYFLTLPDNEGVLSCSSAGTAASVVHHPRASIRPLLVFILSTWVCRRVPDVLQQDDRRADATGSATERAGEQLHGACLQPRRSGAARRCVTTCAATSARLVLMFLT